MNSVRSLTTSRSTLFRRNDCYTDVESSHGSAREIYGQRSIPTKTSVVGGAGKDMELHALPPAGRVQVEHGILLTHSEA